jgi:hypothetical protein
MSDSDRAGMAQKTAVLRLLELLQAVEAADKKFPQVASFIYPDLQLIRGRMTKASEAVAEWKKAAGTPCAN